MPDAISIIEASMLADQTALEVLSHNLANATTPGYKRDLMVSQWFGANLERELEALRQSGVTDPLPLAAARLTDHTAGSLRYTGEPLHLAIEGEALFELAGLTGPVFARAGMFSVDAAGTLVGPGGAPVQGLSGDIRLDTLTPRIDREGVVWDGEARVGQLKLVRPMRDALEKLGDGLFSAGGVPLTPEPGEVAVRQGYIENSNVDSMAEMVRLIETVRRFEAAQQLVRGYDEMMQQALTTIADF